MRIWKYPLEVTDYQDIEMPQDAEILTVQVQRGTPCLWALVNPDKPREARRIFTVGTGHDARHIVGWHYVGTYQLHMGRLVFHVFA
jgi:hypothetical protein